MANQVYESSYIVNSFHAINAETRKPYSADAEGYITVKAGDKIIFDGIYSNEFVSVNTLTFFTKDAPLKVQLNDNTLYPFYIPANDRRGVQYLRVDSITILNDCTFYYEGMVV